MVTMMTRKDVAELLKCSERSIVRLVDDALLREWRMRGLVRYRQDDVEELVAAFDFNRDDPCQCEDQCECVES